MMLRTHIIYLTSIYDIKSLINFFNFEQFTKN
jgi:hypothetical protein